MRVCIIIERLLPEEPSFGCFGLELSLDGMANLAVWNTGTSFSAFIEMDLFFGT